MLVKHYSEGKIPHLLEDPRNNFRYSGKYYYSENKIKAYPVVIEDNRVVLRYLRLVTGSSIDMEFYPFRRQEMIELMQEADFEVVESYGDFVRDKIGEVDFYQHVAIKR